MTIHVNIGEAKTRLSQLIAAALAGEEVILAKDGTPQIRLTPVEGAAEQAKADIIAKRRAALGKWKSDFEGFDITPESIRAMREYRDNRFD